MGLHMKGVRFNESMTLLHGKILDILPFSMYCFRLKLLCTKTQEGPHKMFWGCTRTGLASKVISMEIKK